MSSVLRIVTAQEAVAIGGFRHEKSPHNGTINIELSDKWHIAEQVPEILAKLNDFSGEVHKLQAGGAIEDLCLDIGFNSRLGDGGVAVQVDALPLQLLRMLSELRIGLVLSAYPGGKSEMEARQA